MAVPTVCLILINVYSLRKGDKEEEREDNSDATFMALHDVTL